jgi:hypothetical protein
LVRASRLKAVAVVISYDFSTPGSPDTSNSGRPFFEGRSLGLRSRLFSFLVPVALALIAVLAFDRGSAQIGFAHGLDQAAKRIMLGVVS